MTLVGEGDLGLGVAAKVERARPRPLQPEPHVVRRPRLRPPGLDPLRTEGGGAALGPREPPLRPGRPGPALLQADRARARDLRHVAHRRGPLRDAAAPGGRRPGAARLLAGAGRQGQSALLPRHQRAGGRQRHPRQHADALARLRHGLPHLLRRQDGRPRHPRPARMGGGAGLSGTCGRSRRTGLEADAPRLVLPPAAGRLRRLARDVRPRRPRAAARERLSPALRGPRQVGSGAQRRRALRRGGGSTRSSSGRTSRSWCARASTPS